MPIARYKLQRLSAINPGRHAGEELVAVATADDGGQSWKFKPVRVNGLPAKVIGKITCNFNR